MVQDYSTDLHELARLVDQPQATDELLQRALVAMRALIPYDLATIFRLQGETLRALTAAGPLAGPAVRRHNLSLARFPTIRRALEARQPISLAEHDHASEEGDPYDGVLNLPHGHGCMVVPLFAGEHNLGLITLDRAACGAWPRETVDMAGIIGRLVSLALFFSEQRGLLDRYRHQLKEQNRLLREEAGGEGAATAHLEASRSPAMQAVVQLLRQVAVTDLPVLIRGETGTGKEVAASAVHAWSRRVDGPFVKLNCSAIPENLVESELFGHVKGAFSGAERDRPGRFLTANGGTLLLDEVGDMPLSAQTRLLRVLQEGTFEPVGSDRTVKVDVRVLAATHVDLEAAVAARRFRQDLYYRLSVFPVRLPALRERLEDVAPIAESALDERHRRGGGGPWVMSPEAVAALRTQPWPGNVRELLNAVERATILCPSGAIEPRHLGLAAAAAVDTAPAPASTAALPSWEENERRYWQAVLARTEGRIYGPGGAAEIAGLKPTTLRSRLVNLGLR